MSLPDYCIISERPLSRDTWCRWSFSPVTGVRQNRCFINTRPVLTFGIINAALAPHPRLPPRVSEIDRHNIQRVQQALKSSAAVGARVLRAKSLWSHSTLETPMDYSPVTWYQIRQRKEPLPGYLEIRRGVVISDLIIFSPVRHYSGKWRDSIQISKKN